MTEQQYNKWLLEVCNQEYDGSLPLLRVNLLFAGYIQRFK